MTLNGLILIETTKNIVTSINNDAFAYGLTGSIEPSTEPSIARRGNNSNGSSNVSLVSIRASRIWRSNYVRQLRELSELRRPLKFHLSIYD